MDHAFRQQGNLVAIGVSRQHHVYTRDQNGFIGQVRKNMDLQH
jgi:hypothetical protein